MSHFNFQRKNEDTNLLYSQSCKMRPFSKIFKHSIYVLCTLESKEGFRRNKTIKKESNVDDKDDGVLFFFFFTSFGILSRSKLVLTFMYTSLPELCCMY